MRALVLFSLALSLAASSCVVRNEPPLADRDAASGSDASRDAGPIDVPFACVPDVPGCFGTTHYRCGADGRSRTDEMACPEACDPRLGCVACVPDSRRCEGTVSSVCLPDGSGYRFGRDCADWRVACGAGGYCEDDCARAEASRSYVGCEYYASPLANEGSRPGPRDFDFRVVLANPAPMPTEVTITRGNVLLAREVLVPGAIVDVVLPWIEAASFPFDGSTFESHVTPDAGYRVRSSRPIIATQFNPFQYARGLLHSFSNDASLLLPVHALGQDHVVITYPPLSIGSGSVSTRLPGYVAIVGVTPEPAAVTVVSPVAIAADASGRWAETPAGTALTFVLARGELAQLTPTVPPHCDETRPVHTGSDDGDFTCFEAAHDLSGARVTSDRPIAVYAGHACAFVPFDVAACDHFEESLPPVPTWGRRFETVPFGDPALHPVNFLRIVGTEAGTHLVLDPPPAGSPSEIDLAPLVPLDLTIDGPLAITASAPIEVAQFLLGQNLETPPLPRGDPALTLLVPREQNRIDYELVTPTSYSPVVNGQSWLVVSRDLGATITLDGSAIGAPFTRVGDREIAVVPVEGGAHRATGTSPFGLVAFGLGTYTSYAYPAGLDLRIAPQ
ncbi:MAG: IgGFc-binding protein [Sandaracinus sp.]